MLHLALGDVEIALLHETFFKVEGNAKCVRSINLAGSYVYEMLFSSSWAREGYLEKQRSLRRFTFVAVSMRHTRNLDRT